MKFILGSGIVGLIARDILGPSWTLIPFYKSRFYTFNPSLSDNFIIKNDEISQYIKSSDIGKVQSFPYRRAYSVKGMLYGKHDDGICSDWCTKTFGYDHSSHISAYMKHGMEFDVYDVRINQLYQTLLEKYMPEIKKGMAYGGLSGIMAWIFIYPQDRIKTHIQANDNLSMKSSIKHLINNGNIYKGFHYALMRAVPLHATAFATMEICQKYFSSK